MVLNSLSLLPSSSPPSLPSTYDSINSFTTSCHPRLRRITPRRRLRALPDKFRASFAERPIKEDDDDGEGTTSAAKFAENNSISDFMRFKRGGSAGGDKRNGELQPAVVSYRKKFPWSLLWPFLQMVASRESLENRMNPNSSKRHQSLRYRGFNFLVFIQWQMSRILTLDFQLDCLDYQSENWYHADLDFETFKLLQPEKGESFFTFERDMTLRSTKPVAVETFVGFWGVADAPGRPSYHWQCPCQSRQPNVQVSGAGGSVEARFGCCDEGNVIKAHN